MHTEMRVRHGKDIRNVNSRPPLFFDMVSNPHIETLGSTDQAQAYVSFYKHEHFMDFMITVGLQYGKNAYLL